MNIHHSPEYDNTPFITVVMPVRNEARFIRDTLGKILEQDYVADRFEIIVVDGMSDDGTYEIVKDISKEYHNVRLMMNPKRLPSSGRNIGFMNGKGDIFVVVDGHCYIEDDQLFKNTITCFEKSGSMCLGRPQPLDPPGINGFQKAVALARASRIGHSGNSLIYCNYEGYISPVSNGAVYKREVFHKVGYVDENFDACEDVEFNYRVEVAGFNAYMSPSITVRYYPRENLLGLFNQMMRYGKGRFSFIRKHPEAFNLDMLIPPFFVVGLFLLLCSGLLSVVTSPVSYISDLLFSVFLALSFIYGLYALLISAESLRISLRNGFRYLRHLPLIFFTVHLGLGLGFIKGWIDSINYSRNRDI